MSLDNETKEFSGNVYEALGKFVCEFEYLVFHIRISLRFILGMHGLREMSVADLVFSQSAFSAKLLAGTFNLLVTQLFHNDDENLTALSKFIKGFEKSIEIRNELLHGTWLAGDAFREICTPETQANRDFMQFKMRPQKGVASARSKVQNVEMVIEYTDSLAAQTQEFYELMVRVMATFPESDRNRVFGDPQADNLFP